MMLRRRVATASTYVLDAWLDGTHVGRRVVHGARGWSPLSLGKSGDLVVRGFGVLPIHAWIGVHRGLVYGVSADATAPAFAFHEALATTWTPLTVPCLLWLGVALVEITRMPSQAHARAPADDYHDDDPTLRRSRPSQETTVADTRWTARDPSAKVSE